MSQRIREQVATVLLVEPEEITNMKVDKECHFVDFKLEGRGYWAWLYRNNLSIKKNSVRLDTH